MRMSHKRKFHARHLRVGDYILVNGHQEPARIFRTDHYGTIAVAWEDGRQRWFSSREGYADILAAARPLDGTFKPL